MRKAYIVPCASCGRANEAFPADAYLRGIVVCERLFFECVHCGTTNLRDVPPTAEAPPNPTSGSTPKSSKLEETLACQIAVMSLPEPIREFRFHPERRWRFDFAWIKERLAVEVEGGTWTNGRHNRPQGFQNDTKKYNAAALAGWRVLRYTSEDVRTGVAAMEIRDALTAPAA